MVETLFTPNQVAKVRLRYPGLEHTADGLLGGTIELHATFDGLTLRDKFQIDVTANNPHSSRIPALIETGGRTRSIAEKHGIADLRTLHRNGDGTACVCVKQVEKSKFPDGSSLLDYLEVLAVPYLYGLSYFDLHGKWPWPDFAHGALGLFEFYVGDSDPDISDSASEVLELLRRDPTWRIIAKQLRSPSGKRGCLCGSGKQFRYCHHDAWRGLDKYRRELQRLGYDLDLK